MKGDNACSSRRKKEVSGKQGTMRGPKRPWYLLFLLLFSVNKTSLHINMGVLHEALTVHKSPNNEKLDSLTRVYEPHSKESWDFEQFE